MEERRYGRGLWRNPKPTQYSKETQDMLNLMMQESKLTYFQRKHINECLQNGAALPVTCNPTASASTPEPKTTKSVQRLPSGKSQKRSAESCRSGNSYVREKFCPGPTRDLEKEKRRLQNIFATGQEEPTAASLKKVLECQSKGVVEERDRYEEILDEIEERRQFLADMASLRQEKNYIGIINGEISQRIQELKVLEKARSPENGAKTSEERADCRIENMKRHEERRLTATD